MKPIFMLMEKLIIKTYITGEMPTHTESLKDARHWKTDGVVHDMGQTNSLTRFH
jgi:hypothetical protein